MRQRQEEEEEEEEDYWRVSCVASGGRPETLVSLVTTASDDDEEVEPRRENGTDAGTSVYRLPVRAYEGHNVSCVFTQPKLAEPQTRTLQLPSFSECHSTNQRCSIAFSHFKTLFTLVGH